MEVKFYPLSDEVRSSCRDMNNGEPFSGPTVEDSDLKFAVIISRADGKWVFCKHKDRNTYEVPGGHREEHELHSEIEKVEFFEELPEAWTYPDIQPLLIREHLRREALIK